MRRIRDRALAAAALALLLPAVPRAARADVQQMYAAGAWTLYTGTATSGRAVCDMRVTGETGTRRIDVIYFDNDDHLTVRMDKSSWRIPDRTKVDVVLQFDANPVWTASADGSGQIVEFTVSTNGLNDFAQQFRYGNRMRISFPDGTEEPWLASLAGTNFMLDRFLECVQRIRATGSQPYAAQPAVPTQPTQPTGPSQPFAAPGQTRGGDQAAGAPSFGGGPPVPYRGTQPAAPATPAPPSAPAPAAPTGSEAGGARI